MTMVHISFCLLLLLVLPVPVARSQAAVSTGHEEDLVKRAKAIHESSITLDTHVDIAGSQYATPDLDPGKDNPELRCDLVKMKRGGVDGVFLAVFVSQRGLDDKGFAEARASAMGKFEAIHRLAETMYPDRCELATSPDDVNRISGTGKRAIMIGIENAYPIGMDLSLLKKYFDLGARYITLSHSDHNQICDSSGPSEPMHGGLSNFGREVVAEMNRLGIMVDVSHISEKSFWDVMEIAKAPLIASHSGCAALNPVSRNLTDDQLRAIAGIGGVVQVVALGSFLKADSPERSEAMDTLRSALDIRWLSRQALSIMSEQERAAYEERLGKYRDGRAEIDRKYPSGTLQDFVNHIDRVVKVAGIDSVGIGSDFDGGGGIQGFNDHSEALNVTLELLRRGYSDGDIKRIWGGNLLRVWRQAAEVAAGMQGAARR